MATPSSAPRPPYDRPRRRRLLIAAALVTPLLAACGTGFQAQTNQIYQPGPGISDRVGGIYVINALIVSDGSNGTLVAALINQQDSSDILESVSAVSSDSKPLKATILSGTVALPPHHAVQFAHTSDIRFTGTLTPGANYSVTFTFKTAAPVTMTIPVLPQSPTYAGVVVGPTPPPTTPSHSNP